MSSHALAEPLTSNPNHAQWNAPIVIVGNGPVGIKAAQLLLAKNSLLVDNSQLTKNSVLATSARKFSAPTSSTPISSTQVSSNQHSSTFNPSFSSTNLTQVDESQIVIFGEERHAPYNRVQLSLFLAEKISESELNNPVAREPLPAVKEYLGRKIVAVDRLQKTVTDDRGQITRFSKLILATGSTPVIPNIANVELEGVYQFRTLDDTRSLLVEKQQAKNIYIIGSGPLGLETAVAMKQPGNQVSLEVRSNLLNRDLGEQAQEVLADYVAASGIKIVHHNPLKRIIGDGHLSQLELEDGQLIDCDCLIICAGVKPSTKLAEQINLETHFGIVVDEYMRTSDPDIYAIGECCEFEQMTYGIVSPGFSQAKTCVEHIQGCFREYHNEKAHVQVKFANYSTEYFGDLLVEGSTSYSYTNRLKGIFRKLIVKDLHLIGAIIIGNWEEQTELKIAVKQQRLLTEKALRSFEINGSLLGTPQSQKAKHLPRDYIICLCEGVTRGELSRAITSGCRTVESLGEKTCAGTVCGSCKPLLNDLLDTPTANLVMRHQKAILVTSVLSIALIFATLFFEPLSFANSVQLSWHIEMLWFDNFWKQVSGFSLLSLCLLASALAVRKRFKKFQFGHVDTWRYAHSIVGIVALLVLMVHTGMRLGDNLNFALMMIFLGATLTGSLVGVFMARNHHWSDFKLRKHRLWWSRVHHTLLWMLPPLLGFHILSAYYF